MPHGATILDADGLTLSTDERAFFRDADPFGFILFARNIDTPQQVHRLCAELREAVGRDAIITIDQEGGRVQRMRAPHWREWAPPLDVARRGGARALWLMYRLIAYELRRAGIDSNCAPILDVARADTHPFLQTRCYGQDVQAVTHCGRAVADALLEGGVLPVMKHMPGHGLSRMDSHYDLPRVAAQMEELEDIDFAPFKALTDLPMGMTAHLIYEALDDRPATLSARVVRTIRDDIGFDGLLMSDDISMKALQGTPAESAAQTIAAGVDLALYCNAPLADRIAVAQAAGPMSDAAMSRAKHALAMRRAPGDIDILALEAEFADLMGGTVHG